MLLEKDIMNFNSCVKIKLFQIHLKAFLGNGQNVSTSEKEQFQVTNYMIFPSKRKVYSFEAFAY